MRAKLIATTALGLAAFIGFYDSWYIVNPTEMAGVRRLGTVVTEEPVLPGLHFKLPFIDTADHIQTSQDNLQLDRLEVYTTDNQTVTISVGLTYRVPKAAVLRLLYDVGKTGNVDIARNVNQIVLDRAKEVFAKHNTTKISDEREDIAHALKKVTAESLMTLFGIQVLDYQIPHIWYSETFVQSVEAAVKAKNDSIASENMVVKIRHDGEQKVVTARAEADAKVARAQADKQAAILQAEGEAKRIELETVAEANGMRVKGEALSANPKLVEYVQATRWSGQPPQTVLGNASAVPFFNLTSR